MIGSVLALSYSRRIQEAIAWKSQNVIYIYNFEVTFVYSTFTFLTKFDVFSIKCSLSSPRRLCAVVGVGVAHGKWLTGQFFLGHFPLLSFLFLQLISANLARTFTVIIHMNFFLSLSSNACFGFFL